MKTKKQPKSPIRKCKPIRVINPTGRCHTARVYAGQSITLMLRKPVLFLENCSNEAEFIVTTYSDFLIVECVEENESGDKLYTINQKYDLSGRAEHGEMYLGEINIRLANNTHVSAKKQDYASSVCVIHHGNEEVLTVLNPIAHTVKVEPHQLLEVICSEPAWNDCDFDASGENDKWTTREVSDNRNGHNLTFKQVRYEIVERTAIHLKVNPLLGAISRAIVEQELKMAVKSVREHHWWFAIDDSSQKTVLKLSNDNYEVCTFDFDGTCELRSTFRSVDVLLAVRGKKKNKMHPHFIKPDSVELKLELVKRDNDRMNRVLTNPLSAEQVDFDSSYGEMTVEIIQPNCLWADLGEEVRWDFKIDESNCAPRHCKIEVLDNYYRWGKLFQRIKVKHDFVQKNDTETKFLGAIFITCPGKLDNHDGKKRISFWFTPGESSPTSSYSTPKRLTSATSNTSSCNNSSIYSGKKKEKEYKSPRVSEVEIEELESLTLEDSHKTRKHSEIWVSTNYHQSYCGNYQGHEFYKAEAKKKAGRSTSEYPTRRTFRANENKNGSEESKNEKTGIGGSSTTHKTLIGAGNDSALAPAFIVYNPNDKSKVILDPTQNLIIRMNSPSKLLIGKADNEFWSMTHSHSLKVNYFKTVKVGESYYQEVLIEPENLNAADGIQTIGSIEFECSEAKRLVLIQVDMKEGADTRRKEFSFPYMRVVQPTRTFTEENGARKLHVNDWCHMDAVTIGINDAVYVRSPSHVSGWMSSFWQIQVEQCPLPDSICSHPALAGILGEIDFQNPWFKTEQPISLASMYIFRPLDIQQPHAKEILQAMADVFGDKPIPLAKITFTNERHPKNTRLQTPVGMIETKFIMERTLGLCALLKKEEQREVILTHPAHREEVALKGNETLIIKLSPQFIDLERASGIQPWFIGPWPNFLEFEGQSTQDGDDVFRFRVRGDYPNRSNEWIKFICGNKERTVLAKYEK